MKISQLSLICALAFAAPLIASPDREAPDWLPSLAQEALDDCAVSIRLETESTASGRPEMAWFCGSGFIIARSENVLTNVHVSTPLVVPSGGDLRLESFFEGAAIESETEVFRSKTWRENVSRTLVSAIPVDVASTKGISKFVATADVTTGMRLFTMGNRECVPWSISHGEVTMLVDPENPIPGTNAEETLKNINKMIRENGSGMDGKNYDAMILTDPGFIQNGNNGGPVVDEEGRLVGMALGTYGGYGMVIPLKTVMKAIGRNEPKSSPSKKNPPKTAANATPAANDEVPASNKTAEELEEEEKAIMDGFEME